MTRLPKEMPPPYAVDCHIHVYGDPDRYPSLPVNGEPPPALYLDDYYTIRDGLGLGRTVIIQTPFYGNDNRCLVDSIGRLGQENAKGSASVDPEIDDQALAELDRQGVCGLRFGIELLRGMRPPDLERMADRIAALGWHIQYRSTEKDLPELADRLGRLPVPVCVDHIGSIPPETGTSDPAFEALLRLVDMGRCWVKLSAPYQLSRSGPPAYEDYRAQARALVAAAPERMVWGTNWPHPKVEDKPDNTDLLDILWDWTEDDATRQLILVDNPRDLYGFS